MRFELTVNAPSGTRLPYGSFSDLVGSVVWMVLDPNGADDGAVAVTIEDACVSLAGTYGTLHMLADFEGEQ